MDIAGHEDPAVPLNLPVLEFHPWPRIHCLQLPEETDSICPFTAKGGRRAKGPGPKKKM